MEKNHGDSERHQDAQTQQKQPLAAFIGSTDAARLLDISQTTLERLYSEGRITKITQGTFDPVQLVREFVAYKGGIGARSKVEEQKAIKLERENRKANKELISLDLFKVSINRMVLCYRVWIRALPGRIASTGALQEAGVLHEIVRVEAARISEELAAAALSGFEIEPSAFNEDPEADSLAERLGIPGESLTTK